VFEIVARPSICESIMFVLQFYKLVRQTMDWTDDAPSTVFLNKHMGVIEKRKMQPVENIRLSDSFEELRIYISRTYPRYFGTQLKIGKATVRNRHLISNHPLMRCGRPATA
jgi:hypothetical protein